MKPLLRYLVLITLASAVAASSVLASTPAQSTTDQIVEFFTVEPSSDLVVPSGLETDEPQVEILTDVVEAVVNADVERLQARLQREPAAGQALTAEQRIALSFAESVRNVLVSDPEGRSARMIELLEGFEFDNNWYVDSVAESLLAFQYVTQGNFLVAARHADMAMALIPSELSAKALDARLRASEAAMLLHGYQGNPGFLLESAKILRETKQTLGQDINRYELMTNFVYTLNRARDFEGAARIAEMLINEPKPEDVVTGLAESYMASTFNETGEYERARSLSRYAMEASTHPVIQNNAGMEYAVALSGLGLEDQADAHMQSIGMSHTPEELLTSVRYQAIIHAEALLAMHRGETAYALALMKRRADIMVGRIQSANSGDMSAMLSNLENTRERQTEREEALQREAELQAVQLEQKNRLNRLLWILIAVLTIAFNMLLAFLRYREKNNRKLQTLSQDALSAEKMKTEFLGVINHELRTPLNGIIGISDAMIHNTEDPELLDQAKAVQDSGQLLFDLLDSLITMSTIEGDRLTLDNDDVRLDRIVSAQAIDWERPAEDKGLTFTHFVGPELENKVVGDAKRLTQCLHYLLSNAIKFTHEGRVHLHATGQTVGNQLHATLIVADTGQGISEEVQSRMFKPFLQADASMTRKYGGAGLSLAIARKLARMMGGDLTVNSREDRGSEFTLTVKLPLLAHQDQDKRSAESRKQVEAELESRDLAGLAAMRADVDPLPDLESVDDPEEIIDLMLGHPIFSNASADDETEDEDQVRQKIVG